MALADTAQLLVKLTLKDETTGPATKAKGSLADFGKTALMVGGAAGFGALAKGALDAEEAQGEFMAATGKSREEAKAFVDDMNGLAGTAGAVGLSFDQITDAGIAVSQQFQVTGAEAQTLTGDILNFSKVTGQDAAQAAMDLEDTLSAFGLEASDAAGFMDVLVASNQKFGTDAGPEALAVLQGMAPALQAMGMEIGDGVELLNAFEVAGLDAGTAQRGLQTAIADLKPGQNLDDLIAELGAIEDPTKRAQRAIEIFGTKAGAGLALVIKPGMTSLDDFGVSAEEAADKTDKAAEDMMTTSDKIRGIFDKLAAGARDIGQDLGPVVTGMASLSMLLGPMVPKLSGVTTALWLKVAALKAADTSWKDMLKSAGPAAAVMGGVAIGLIGVNEGLNKSNEELSEFLDLWREAPPELRKTWSETEVLGLSLGEITTGLESVTNTFVPWHPIAESAKEVNTEVRTAGIAVFDFGKTLGGLQKPVSDTALVVQDSWQRMNETTTQGAADVTDSWQRMGLDVVHTMATTRSAVLANARQMTDDLAGTVRGGKDKLQTAMDDLMWAIKNPMAQTRLLAGIEGALMGDRLGDALASKNPFIRGVAEQTKANLVGQWESITGQAWGQGQNAGQQYGSGLASESDDAAEIARRMRERIREILSGPMNINVQIGINNKLRNLPHFHQGGFLPAGGIGVAGEKGPELITGGRRGVTVTPMGRNRAIPYGGAPQAQQMSLAVTVQMSAREVTGEMNHYAIVGGRPAVMRT